MDPFPIFTNRLIIRDFTMADEDAVHEYGSDAEVVRYMPWGPNTREETRGYLEHVTASQAKEPRTLYDMALVLRDNHQLIGACGIHITRTDVGEAALGYCLHRSYWGQGYMSEAARAMVAFAFEQLKMHRVFATCDPNNIGSRQVMEKIGMTYEGRLRDHQRVKGAWRDSLVHSILKPEYLRGD
ncbi:MAG: GNAT family N-acetyltransferase [Bacillota bacterium]